MKTIKIDVDGVIRNIIPVMCRLYNRRFSEHIQISSVTHYDVNEVFTKCPEPTNFFFIKNCRKVFLDSKPFKNTQKALTMLHNAGYKIIICTWQMTYESKMYTLAFLNNNNLYYDDICFTKDKYIINADIIVDDNPDFLSNPLYDNVEKILIDAPYNRNIHLKDTKRFLSLYDYACTLLK